MNNNLTDERVKTSAMILANASELVAHVITNIAGNDIGNAINGNRISMQTMRSLAIARFHRLLENTTC
jgi:hypothetical protein